MLQRERRQEFIPPEMWPPNLPDLNPVDYVTTAPGWAVATAGINSKVDVCEKAKHHTELFWW